MEFGGDICRDLDGTCRSISHPRHTELIYEAVQLQHEGEFAIEDGMSRCEMISEAGYHHDQPGSSASIKQ